MKIHTDENGIIQVLGHKFHIENIDNPRMRMILSKRKPFIGGYKDRHTDHRNYQERYGGPTDDHHDYIEFYYDYTELCD